MGSVAVCGFRRQPDVSALDNQYGPLTGRSVWSRLGGPGGIVRNFPDDKTI